MRRFVLLLMVSIFTLNVSATHIMGGEITWECIKDLTNPDVGKYIFKMKIYRDCDGTTLSTFSQTIDVWGHPTVTTITLDWVVSTDISPSCDFSNSGFAPLDCITNPVGAVEEYIYESQPVSLPGVPAAAGWHFTWDSCCRNGAVSNLVLSSVTSPNEGFTLRASMFPYTDLLGNLVPADPCFDSSPIFKEQAKTILCTGYPFSYSNLGFDVELDSVSYQWDEPLDDMDFGVPYNPPVNPIPVPWLAPYSMNNPLPGGVTLNFQSGEISYNSTIAGNFASVIRVDAFKCGQKVASIYREIQVVLMNCGTLPSGTQNSPPVITAPIGNQSWITTLNSSTGLPSYETTIMAGELVSFSVVATDTDINTTGNMQDLSLEVEGGQLDPTLALSNLATFTVTSSSPGSISGDFLWQSNCDHMQDYGCGRAGGAFRFNLKAYDDFCPANGIVIATISINVIPPQPDLRCLSVDVDGGVELSFSFPEGVIDTNIQYDIYYSKQLAGPYSLIDSVNFPDTTSFHLGSDANASKSYYYLLGSVTCGSNLGNPSDSLLYSDTLSSIFMNAVPINFGVTAYLDWNPMHNPLLSSSSVNYDLHYINSQDNDNLIASFPDLFYQMDGDRCDYIPKFYVEISDASGCVSKSSIGTAHLQDTISPITPIIKDVSVNNLGKAVVSWELSPDSKFYIIYLQANDGAWLTLDTVSSVFSSYVYEDSDAINSVENFSVKAVDSCGNTRGRSLVHNSIFATNSYDVCTYSILLEWNEYINWNNGVNHYKVFLTEMDSNNIFINYSEIRVADNTELLINNTSSLSTYLIYIEAYNEDSTFIAKSNVLDINVELPKRPLFNYLEYATISHDNGYVEINCLVDNNAVIDHYDIYRTEEFDINEMGINFSKIDEVNFSGNTNFIFNDEYANTNTTSYSYKVYPVDTCGVSQSPPPFNGPIYFGEVSFAKTILLNVEKNNNEKDFLNTVSFNEYEKWLGNVSKYELYRSINNEPYNLVPIWTWDRKNQPEEELIFYDQVTHEGKGNGRFCYYIKASEGNITPYGAIPEGSSSNIACVSQTPLIYMPNTFTPNNDEHNELFMPETYFVSEVGYSFSVYSKQGEEIFTTNLPLKGWDGTLRGKKVQNDNYVYYLEYLNGDGKLIEKKGIVSLVR